MERLKETEELLEKCEQDLESLKKISKELKRIEVNRNKLEKYYSEEYMSDYENLASENLNYRILNQDSVWNVLSDQYAQKIKLLKSIIQTI